MGIKKVLVTGGAGFIGSHLCANLVKEGHRVISLDNYFTGLRDRHVPGVEYREGHTKDIERLVPDEVDLVFHLGEYSRVEKSLEDPPRLVWDMNTAGTFAVLEFCRKRRCKIVYAGSSTKFSVGENGRDLTPYTFSKAMNTDLVRNYGKWYGLPYAVTYFYNVYGPGEISQGPYSTLIGIFSEETRLQKPLTVVAPGTQKRNFTHVSDIVAGLMLVGEKGEGKEYGIGAGESYSIIEVAKMFGGEILMLPERRGNRMASELDDSQTRSLGWAPKVRLEDYVKRIVEEARKSPTINGRNVLVFTTTFSPVEGPSGRALLEMMRRLPGVHFDVITTAFSPQAKVAVSPLPNVTVHRLGRGQPSDKFLLPWLARGLARQLMAKNDYLFIWSIMASYAGLASVLSRRGSGLPLLVSLADQKLDRVPWWLRFLPGWILKEADQVSVVSGDQEAFAKKTTGWSKLSVSNNSGDVFANQIRFAFNSILKGMLND